MAVLYNLSSSRRWRLCLTICLILRSNNNMKELLESQSSDSWGLRLLMRRSTLSESTPSESKMPYACLMVSQFDVILFSYAGKKTRLSFKWTPEGSGAESQVHSQTGNSSANLNILVFKSGIWILFNLNLALIQKICPSGHRKFGVLWRLGAWQTMRIYIVLSFKKLAYIIYFQTSSLSIIKLSSIFLANKK